MPKLRPALMMLDRSRVHEELAMRRMLLGQGAHLHWIPIKRSGAWGLPRGGAFNENPGVAPAQL